MQSLEELFTNFRFEFDDKKYFPQHGIYSKGGQTHKANASPPSA
jgi:hypothetical protein